ncbi:MAG: NADH-quinone oxidoreductase subunit J [Planctomycetota bacterium]|nr:NADH-quinone oxidoreductase subunit J [Planctomycetota bacterium]
MALTQNVVRMAFWLIVSLGSASGLFFLLNADFVGATQLLIYVGGTVVLLIFGVMLTTSGPLLKIPSSPGELIQSAVVGVLFISMFFFTVWSVDWEHVANTARVHDSTTDTVALQNDTTGRPIGMAFLGVRPDRDLGAAEGQPLSTGYFLPFEIVSMHLLVVLIGAAYLARAKRQITTAESRSEVV